MLKLRLSFMIYLFMLSKLCVLEPMLILVDIRVVLRCFNTRILPKTRHVIEPSRK